MGQPSKLAQRKNPRSVSPGKATPAKEFGSQARRETLLICLLLSIVSCAVYLRSLGNGFIDYDDGDYITQNSHVRSGLNYESIRWAFTTYTAGNWHPLVWISHELDVEMFGLSPAGHHFSSMLLHSLNTLLLFLLLWKATGARFRSLIVAALFAVHPLNVECVAWAAERKSLLSTLLFLLALGAYGWYVKLPSVRRYGILVLLFACGLMAKPMVITLPFVLLLLDYWPLGRMNIDGSLVGFAPSRKSFWNLALEKTPLLVLSAASAIITIIAQKEAVVPLAQMPVWLRLDNAISSYALYFLKAAWPLRLGVFYPVEPPTTLWTIFCLAILSVISFWVWRQRKRRGYLLIGWLCYLGILVPVVGIVQVGAQAMADRYAYIPLVGIFVMVVWRVGDFVASHDYSPRLVSASTCVLLLALAGLTTRQTGYWRSQLSLWTHTWQVTPTSFVAENNLGYALMDAGRDDEAVVHFDNSIRMKPNEPLAHIALGYFLRERDPRRAIEQNHIALSLSNDPKHLLAVYANLGIAYTQIEDYASAADCYRQALKLDPKSTTAMMALGNVLLRQAAQKFENALGQRPTADGFSQAGSLWEQAGDKDRAKKAYQSALVLNAQLSSAQSGLKRLAEKDLH